MERCAWPKSGPEITYHDTEWGVPEHDDQKLFEFLVLEGAQAGLSWSTILDKRDGYKRAFSGFDPGMVSKYTKRDVTRLLADKSIIRNRLKIESAINNAKRFLEVQEEFGTFDKYLWGFVNHRQKKNRFKSHKEIPAHTSTSESLSRDLKLRKFTFVGPVICYSLMQATGMVNDHTQGCFMYEGTF
ncbi:MAG: DNA-3-methyladenine glycosylase I [Nitrosopumilus sp. H8]|nr:MAG: DNA-3-methyladenine glycosylase I [Nitrosopumilus sp. H8]